jgi:dihydroflavonol-4-reductase
MRALVTGATGCVGANIAEALLARGYSVRALRRATSRLDALDGLSYEDATGDLLDRRSLEAAMEGCVLVFHAAAVSQYWRNSLEKLYTVNVTGTRNVLAAARAAGVQRVVVTSSVAPLGVPVCAGQWLDENSCYHRPPARFHYAHSKLLVEADVARAVAVGQDVLCVNLASVIGRRDVNFVGGEILRLVKRGLFPVAPPGGMGVVAAGAVGLGHVLAAERGVAGERYVLNGENIKHIALLRLVASVVGGRAPLCTLPKMMIQLPVEVTWLTSRALGFPYPAVAVQADLSVRDMYYDGSKAVRELGFPVVSARAAIEEAWDWYSRAGML